MLLQTIYRALAFWSAALLAGVLLVGLFVLPILIYFGKDLPDYKQLTNYDPPTISRIYTSTGELMSELAIERRIYRKIDEIPQVVINAFIAAEDQNYYNHPGIDVFSIIRAGIQNLANIGTERNPVGGSTITQQVVKNFLLTNERSLSRKIKEAILAYRINNVYSKDKILELYLNQIYLGNSAYGVTSAALNYFNKDLKYVTIEEAALIAALPKAPSILDPTKNQERAKARRDWVIDRMREEGYISSDEVKKAQDTPIKLSTRFESSVLDNGYYTESVRLELIERYGFDYVYQEGISAFTNLDKDMQKYADAALRNGLLAYDKKHGYRGPIKTITVKGGDWKSQLNQIETPEAAVSWRLAVVLENAAGALSVGFKDGAKGLIPATNTQWARPGGKDNIKVGDVILVGTDKDKAYTLEQLPRVNGGLVAIQPKTGKVLAMSGGYSFKGSKYNRALQALRQPGSTFKPFVYLAALEKGYGPTSIVKDEPISISQGPDKPAWTPKNYEGKFLGEITMRQALE
ncbi:MAG: penicillin-binding protein 1A, partial [Alphaproteobacteria bacterium]